MSSFSAVSQLTKHGWTEGNGLGRNEHGMAEAIKVNLKFDTRGVGHDAAEEFTYHWWDHAFNKAASSIKVGIFIVFESNYTCKNVCFLLTL